MMNDDQNNNSGMDEFDVLAFAIVAALFAAIVYVVFFGR